MIDYKEMVKKTKKTPKWLHFGAGNIFGGFIAVIEQRLLEKGLEDTGIVVAEAFDYEIIDKVYEPYNNEILCVTLKKDGTIDKEKVKSIAYTIKASKENEELERVVTNKSLQMISFTITEKGYLVTTPDGDLREDIKTGKSIISIVTYMLYKRYMCETNTEKYPIALVSMDNCSCNGDRLKNAVITNARYLLDIGVADDGFLKYLQDEKRVSFPLSMIDKITPRPSKGISDRLNMPITITEKHTYCAPFVNTEQAQYLVIEDKFPAKRPLLERAGVYMTDRETVEAVEKMKVTTCLNPLHTALAVYGCLLGYKSISDEMKDKELKQLICNVAYKEGMKVVIDPKIISPEKFLEEVIEERLPNAFIPDTPQRIACDTSMKIAIRFGETIKSYVKRDDLDASNLRYIPLVLAGWLRYLLGVDDMLEDMKLSNDPRLNELQKRLEGIKAGDAKSYNGQLKEILKDETIFGVDLYEVKLAEKVEKIFVELIQEKGAVQKTLRKYL